MKGKDAGENESREATGNYVERRKKEIIKSVLMMTMESEAEAEGKPSLSGIFQLEIRIQMPVPCFLFHD